MRPPGEICVQEFCGGASGCGKGDDVMERPSAKPGEIIVGLDIGSTTVRAVVGEIGSDGVDITGVGESRSRGMRKGVVVNIESTQQSIREAVDKASMMAGVQIATVFSGIAGSHLRGVNSHGIVSIANHECSREDVDRVLDQARRISMPLDRTVIHVLPQDFVIDQQDGVREPVGMSGVRIEARVHLVTAAVSSVQNVTKCIERCNLHVTELVLTPLASAEAVLTDDEKEIGVALVDIGGGATDVVIYSEGSLRHTAVLPIGGENLTNDIAAGLRTPASEAERIKVRYGCAMRSMVDPEETLEVPGVGGRPSRTLSRDYLASIAEPRMEELFQCIAQALHGSGMIDRLNAGVVLCGGGSLLEGSVELAEQVLQVPVRRGVPTGVGGMVEMVRSPAMATAVGLVKYGAARPARIATPSTAGTYQGPVKASATTDGRAQAAGDGHWWGKFRGWLGEVF